MKEDLKQIIRRKGLPSSKGTLELVTTRSCLQRLRKISRKKNPEILAIIPNSVLKVP